MGSNRKASAFAGAGQTQNYEFGQLGGGASANKRAKQTGSAKVGSASQASYEFGGLGATGGTANSLAKQTGSAKMRNRKGK